MTHSLYYILIGQTPEPSTAEGWVRWLAEHDRVVHETRVGDYFVSTIFLGLNANYIGRGPPILFETVIFGPDGNSPALDYQRRCSTWEEAKAMHERACAMVNHRRDNDKQALT